ncbi:hypothetical protein [Aquimarina litoralis]
MKNYIKQFVFILTAILIAINVTSCQKDDEFIKETTYEDETQEEIEYKGAKLRRVNIEQIAVLDNFVSKKVTGTKSKNSSSKSVLETVFGTVELENIMEITDSNNYVNYTLRIKPEKAPLNTFFNLVIHQKPTDNEPSEAFVYEYQMSTEFALDYSNGRKELKDFEGVIKKYLLADFEFNNSSKVINNCSDQLTPCEIKDVDPDVGNGDSNDGDISDPLDGENGDNGSGGGTGDGSNGSGPGNTGDGDTGNGDQGDGDQGDGAPDITCVNSYHVFCCDNNRCDEHAPRRKGWGSNGQPIFCSGSVTISITECTQDKSLNSKASTCGGGGVIGIDDDQFLGGGFPNGRMLENILGIARIDYLQGDCSSQDAVRTYWNNGDQTQERAYLIADLIDFWNNTGGPSAEYTSVLAVRIMNRESQQKISTSDARRLFSLKDRDNYSDESINFSNEYLNIISMGNQTEKNLANDILQAMNNNTVMNVQNYLNLNTSPSQIGFTVACCPDHWDSNDGNVDEIFSYGITIIKDASDATFSLLQAGTELVWPDELEGAWIKAILEKEGIEVPNDVSYETLGELFKMRVKNGDIVVLHETGIAGDLLELGIYMADLVAIISPSKGGGAFLAINGGEKVTLASLRPFLNRLKDSFFRPVGDMVGKRIGHTFSKHGLHNTPVLKAAAKNSKTPQGQWLNEIEAEKFIARHLDQLSNGAIDIPIPSSIQNIGRVFRNGDGAILNPTHIRLVPSGSGVRSAYPINSSIQALETLGTYVP